MIKICDQCGEEKECKKTVYDEYFCEECLEDKINDGYYDKMD